jgi:hypothetical protein
MALASLISVAEKPLFEVSCSPCVKTEAFVFAEAAVYLMMSVLVSGEAACVPSSARMTWALTPEVRPHGMTFEKKFALGCAKMCSPY